MIIGESQQEADDRRNQSDWLRRKSELCGIYIDQFTTLLPEPDKMLTALILSQLPKGYVPKEKVNETHHSPNS